MWISYFYVTQYMSQVDRNFKLIKKLLPLLELRIRISQMLDTPKCNKKNKSNLSLASIIQNYIVEYCLYNIRLAISLPRPQTFTWHTSYLSLLQRATRKKHLTILLINQLVDEFSTSSKRSPSFASYQHILLLLQTLMYLSYIYNLVAN